MASRRGKDVKEERKRNRGKTRNWRTKGAMEKQQQQLLQKQRVLVLLGYITSEQCQRFAEILGSYGSRVYQFLIYYLTYSVTAIESDYLHTVYLSQIEKYLTGMPSSIFSSHHQPCHDTPN